MIIAKLNPGISITYQETPFTTPTTTTYNWITAVIQRYIPGASIYKINLIYGTVEMDESETLPVFFNRADSYHIKLTAAELSTWGTDDVVLLEILEAKLGINIENTYEIEDSFQ